MSIQSKWLGKLYMITMMIRTLVLADRTPEII
jgi:hypothetical protein